MSSPVPPSAPGAPISSPSTSPSAPEAKIYQHGDWEFAWQSGGIAPSPVVDAYETLLEIKTPEILFPANFLRMRHNPSGLTFAFDAKHALSELKASYAGWGRPGDRTHVPPLSPSAAAAAGAPEDAGKPGYVSASSPLPPPAPVQVVVAPLWARRVLTGPATATPAPGAGAAAAAGSGAQSPSAPLDVTGVSSNSLATDLSKCCSSTAAFIAATGSGLAPASAAAAASAAGAAPVPRPSAPASSATVSVKIVKVGPGATTLGLDGKPPVSSKDAFTLRRPASTTTLTPVPAPAAAAASSSLAPSVTATAADKSPVAGDAAAAAAASAATSSKDHSLAPPPAPISLSAAAEPGAAASAATAAPTTIASRDPRFAFDWTYSTPYGGHVLRWHPLVPRSNDHDHAHGHDHCHGNGAAHSQCTDKCAGDKCAPEDKPSGECSTTDKVTDNVTDKKGDEKEKDASKTVPAAPVASAPVPSWSTAPPSHTIPYHHLSRREPIVFAASLPLFEDELHDHGASRLSLKLRVMPSCFFLLLRCFVRVDGVLVRSRETRYFHFFRSNFVVREARHLEASVGELSAAGHPVEMGAYVAEDEAVQRLVERARVTHVMPLESDTKGADKGKEKGKEVVPEVIVK